MYASTIAEKCWKDNARGLKTRNDKIILNSITRHCEHCAPFTNLSRTLPSIPIAKQWRHKIPFNLAKKSFFSMLQRTKGDFWFMSLENKKKSKQKSLIVSCAKSSLCQFTEIERESFVNRITEGKKNSNKNFSFLLFVSPSFIHQKLAFALVFVKLGMIL